MCASVFEIGKYIIIKKKRRKYQKKEIRVDDNVLNEKAFFHPIFFSLLVLLDLLLSDIGFSTTLN